MKRMSPSWVGPWPFLLVLAGVAACRQPPPIETVSTTAAEIAAAPVASLEPASRRAGGCETLVDVEAPDTLRLADGNLVLYANEQVGLAVVDVGDPDRPAMKGIVELVGEPAGVFDVRGMAVLVYAPAARPQDVAVRAVTLEPLRTMGELTLAGRVRDVRRVGDHVVVTRETPDHRTAVTAFGVTDTGLVRRSEVVLDGASAVAGAAPRGLAIARSAAIEHGPNRTSVTWLTLDPDAGALAAEGTITVSGVIPRWRSAHRVIDVTEDQRARLVLCATSGCATAEPAAYAALDFSTPAEPRVVSWKLVAGAGDGTIGFQGTRLVVARPVADRSDASELAFYATESDLALAGKVRVRGSVGTIAVRDSGDVVTVGWTGSASAGKRAILHHVDARGVPRLVGAATFGGDWTWSRAYDDDRVLGFDPHSTLAALPMTTVHGSHGPTSAAEVLSLDPSGPRAIAEEPLTLADRLLFVNGRLLSFSADGVVVLRGEGEPGAEQRWPAR